MPRGRPKSTKGVSKLTAALTETLAAQTPEVQAVVVQERLDEVATFQRDLEEALPATFDLLKTLRDARLDKEAAPGAKVNLEAAKVMMENTHRLHPERGVSGGPPVTVNVLIQMLAKPRTGQT